MDAADLEPDTGPHIGTIVDRGLIGDPIAAFVALCRCAFVAAGLRKRSCRAITVVIVSIWGGVIYRLLF